MKIDFKSKIRRQTDNQLNYAPKKNVIKNNAFIIHKNNNKSMFIDQY